MNTQIKTKSSRITVVEKTFLLADVFLDYMVPKFLEYNEENPDDKRVICISISDITFLNKIVFKKTDKTFKNDLTNRCLELLNFIFNHKDLFVFVEDDLISFVLDKFRENDITFFTQNWKIASDLMRLSTIESVKHKSINVVRWNNKLNHLNVVTDQLLNCVKGGELNG
ncbi:MAG: hypothetical protein MJ093_00340 [Saccharofermentans sp.]|nr:hypothetical protein [Saccharofermentans sp.]